MKNTVILFFLLFFASCVTKTETKTTSGNISSSAPYIWSDRTFPKTLQISNDFSNAEVTNIQDMSTAWKTALQNNVTFFNYGARIADISNNVSSMDDFYDSVMGVYKTTRWPDELPLSALAVTQIFGRRYNTGTSSEFVNIEHADILVNDDFFTFRTNNTDPGYDLQTVVLHEMGHFLGLLHNTASGRNNTIMYPSINSSEQKRAPLTVDISAIASKYSINLGGGGGHAMAGNLPNYQVPQGEAGHPVKILIELHADGSCVHKENGVVVGRH